MEVSDEWRIQEIKAAIQSFTDELRKLSKKYHIKKETCVFHVVLDDKILLQLDLLKF